METAALDNSGRVPGLGIQVNGRRTDSLILSSDCEAEECADGLTVSGTIDSRFVRSSRVYRVPLAIETEVSTESNELHLFFHGQGDVNIRFSDAGGVISFANPVTGRRSGFRYKGPLRPNPRDRIVWEIDTDTVRLFLNGVQLLETSGNFAGLEGPLGIGVCMGDKLDIHSVCVEERPIPPSVNRFLGKGSQEVEGLVCRPHASSLFASIRCCLNGMNRPVKDAWLFGATGYAFDPTARDDDISADAIEAFNERLIRVGYQLKRLPGDTGHGEELRTPEQHIRHSIGQGEPLIVHRRDIGQYSVVTGFDDGGFLSLSASGEERTAWDRLSENGERSLTLYKLQSVRAPGSHTVIADVLRNALEQYDRVRLCKQEQPDAAGDAERRELAGRFMLEVLERLGDPYGDFCTRSAEADAFESLRDLLHALERRVELDSLRFKGMNVSHLGALKGCLDHLQLSCTESWLYGVTGHAFLSAADAQMSNRAFNFGLPNDRLRLLAQHVGVDIVGISRYTEGTSFRELQTEAEGIIRQAIKEGAAVYGRGIDEGSETSVVYGFQEEGLLSSGWHNPKAGYIPWNRLGRPYCTCDACVNGRNASGPDVPLTSGYIDLHVVRRVGTTTDDLTAVREGLRFALEHAEGDARWLVQGYATGLQAYDVWIRSMVEGTAEGFNVGYNSDLWKECRMHAVKFLKEAKGRLAGAAVKERWNEADGRVVSAFDEAIGRYESVYAKVKLLADLFPWMQPRGPIRDLEKKERAISLLREIRELEQTALESLAQLLHILSEGENK